MLFFATPLAVGLLVAQPPIRSASLSRCAQPVCNAWAAVAAANTRESTKAALDAAQEAGEAKLWGSFKLAPRPVSLRELSQTTKLSEKVLDPTQDEYSTEDIRNTFIKVLFGTGAASLAFALLGDALGLDAGFRFVGTYAIAGIPIAILAIGSIAPGILFLPIEAYKSITASADEKKTKTQRVCKHEASHLLCAYCLGMPVDEVSAGSKGPQVVVYDEAAVQTPGRFVPQADVGRLAVVAMSGLMAEADAYGRASGANEDLSMLGQVMLRAQPQMAANEQQDMTRYAALTAWTIVKKHEDAFDAITEALAQGKSAAECLQAAEAAELGSAAKAEAAKRAKEEMLANETPQQRAAREREEMAARGRF